MFQVVDAAFQRYSITASETIKRFVVQETPCYEITNPSVTIS